MSKKTGEKIPLVPQLIRCSGCRRCTVVNPSCGERNCERCMTRHSRKLMRKYLPRIKEFVNKPGHMWTFITLEGVRVAKADLRHDINRFTNAATDFLRDEYAEAGLGVLEYTEKIVVRSLVQIFAGGLESVVADGACTLIHYERQLYIHYHAIVRGGYKEINGLATHWREALLETGFLSRDHDPLGGKHGVKLSLVRNPNATAKYIIGYITKMTFLSDADVELLRRLKYVRSWGLLYGVYEEPTLDMICADCGAKCYFDFQSFDFINGDPPPDQKLTIHWLEKQQNSSSIVTI